MKFIKAIILLFAVLVLGGVAVSVGGWFMLRGTPEWYKPDTSTPAQRKMAARNAENMLIRMRNWAGASRAYGLSQVSAIGPTTSNAKSILSHEPSQPFQIQFTDAELNAFYDKWADAFGRRVVIEQYVSDPQLVLRDHQLILVGTVKELGTVVSMQFEPRIDPDGNLQMNLVRVLGGILPLPDALWTEQREKLERTLSNKLPEYQESAKIAPDGTSNAAAAAAGMDKLFLSVLHRDPADAVVFVPYDAEPSNRSIPAKITAISIQENTLTMTVKQMTAAEREALLERLRAKYAAATAMSP